VYVYKERIVKEREREERNKLIKGGFKINIILSLSLSLFRSILNFYFIFLLLLLLLLYNTTLRTCAYIRERETDLGHLRLNNHIMMIELK
jgi:hypothetical protein